MHRPFVLALALSLGVSPALSPTTAAARAKGEVSYPFNAVWTTLVRLVRVDLGCVITEKDKEEGYVMFDYADVGRTVPGTIELVRSKRGATETVSLVVQIPAMPGYVERMVIDRLERKLRQELGQPIIATQPAPTPASAPRLPSAEEAAEAEANEAAEDARR